MTSSMLAVASNYDVHSIEHEIEAVATNLRNAITQSLNNRAMAAASFLSQHRSLMFGPYRDHYIDYLVDCGPKDLPEDDYIGRSLSLTFKALRKKIDGEYGADKKDNRGKPIGKVPPPINEEFRTMQAQMFSAVRWVDKNTNATASQAQIEDFFKTTSYAMCIMLWQDYQTNLGVQKQQDKAAKRAETTTKQREEQMRNLNLDPENPEDVEKYNDLIVKASKAEFDRRATSYINEHLGKWDLHQQPLPPLPDGVYIVFGGIVRVFRAPSLDTMKRIVGALTSIKSE